MQKLAEKTYRTQDLLEQTLTNLGLEMLYFPGRGDTTAILVDYKGEHFAFEVDNEHLFLKIIVIKKYRIPMSNLDLYADVRKVMNYINRYELYTYYYVNDDEHKRFDINVKVDIPFTYGILDNPEDYLRIILDAFFIVDDKFQDEMKKLGYRYA